MSLDSNRDILSESAPGYNQTLDLIINEMNRNEAVEIEEYKFENDTKEIEQEKNKNNEKVDNMWTLLNCLFVVGGMIGGLTSKFFSEAYGRKRGLLFHYMFSIAGSILVILSHYFKLVECLLASRFLYGLHGGMSCSMVPTYLAEVSPPALRGRTGVINQLLIVTGIFIGQVVGMKQFLGNEEYWYVLLAIPGFLAVLAAFLFLVFFSDTPRNLLIHNQDEISARRGKIIFFCLLNQEYFLKKM
jgi:MFS family permease